jgi:uncharacterized protein involved in exopolysaccharide biosynthesis/Mrp family chromosome partitioning ATPase
MRENDSDQILSQLQKAFRRHKYMILGITAAAVAVALVYNIIADPIYEASTAMVFDEFTGPVPSFAAVYSQEIKSSNRIQELSSESFSKEVLEILTPADRARIKLPEKRTPDFDEKEYQASVIRNSMTATPVRKSSLVRISVRLADPVLAAEVANSAAKAYQARTLRVQQEGVRSIRLFIEEQLDRFRGQLDDSEVALRGYKEANRISTFETHEQEVLRRLTEAEVLYNETTTNRQALEERLGEITKSISAGRKDFVPQATEVSSTRLQRLRERLVELQLQSTDLQLRGYQNGHPKMDELNNEIAQVKQNLGDEAKKVAEGGGELSDPIAQLAKYGDEQLSLNIEIETMKAKEKAFQKVMGSYDATLSHLPEQELTLARLTRERDVNRRIFDNLLEKLEETKISEAENVPSVRIVDMAVPDTDPIHPRKTVNLAIGLFLGLIGGAGVALVRESGVKTMESVQELEETTGWPALASLPSHPVPEGELPVGGGEPLIGERQVRARKRSLITLLEPGSGPSEAYRMLRTNLKFRGVGDRIRTVAITSTEPNEGKTTIVSNLAISFATMGDRVLVLDAEIRRAGMHEIFGVPLRPGLSDLIAVRARTEKAAAKIAVGHVFGTRDRGMVDPEGIEYADSSQQEVPIRVAIHPTAIRNLSVLPAGTSPENPADALASHVEALRRVFDAVKNDFDVILIDTPPLAIVHDTAILAQFVDVVMFVVNSRRIDRELLMRSRSVLERSGANVVGTVLNQVEPIGTYKSNPYYYRARSSGVSRS